MFPFVVKRTLLKLYLWDLSIIFNIFIHFQKRRKLDLMLLDAELSQVYPKWTLLMNLNLVKSLIIQSYWFVVFLLSLFKSFWEARHILFHFHCWQNYKKVFKGTILNILFMNNQFISIKRKVQNQQYFNLSVSSK